MLLAFEIITIVQKAERFQLTPSTCLHIAFFFENETEMPVNGRLPRNLGQQANKTSHVLISFIKPWVF